MPKTPVTVSETLDEIADTAPSNSRFGAGIDIELHSSKQVYVLWLIYCGIGALLASRFGLLFWQWAVFLVVLCAVLYLCCARMVKVTQIIGDAFDCWQLIIQTPKHRIRTNSTHSHTDTPKNTELWQANLIRAHHASICIVLEFLVFEPVHQKLTLTIYPKQVTADEWRQLCRLVRFKGAG